MQMAVTQGDFAAGFRRVCAGIVAMLLGSLGALHGAERIVLDFSEQQPGDDLPGAIGSAHLMELNDPTITFLTPESSPPTPFADGTHALAIEQKAGGSEGRVRIRIMPFYETGAPEVGWLELELVVNSETHNGFEIGSGSLSGAASADSPVYDGNILVGVNINTDSPISFASASDESGRKTKQGTPSPEIGVPFRLRISWDFSAENPVVSFSFNGEPIMDSDLSELQFEIPTGNAQAGVDYISIILRNAILGKITASE